MQKDVQSFKGVALFILPKAIYESYIKGAAPWKIDFIFVLFTTTCLVFWDIFKKHHLKNFPLDCMWSSSLFFICYVCFMWRHIWQTNKWIAREDAETFII